MNVKILFSNYTGEKLARDGQKGAVDWFPETLDSMGLAKGEGAADGGWVTYKGSNGSVTINWEVSGDGSAAVTSPAYKCDCNKSTSGDRSWVIVANRLPVAGPTTLSPIAVAPNVPAAVDTPNAHVIRAAIAKSAQDELNLWNGATTDDQRVALRRKYVSATNSPGPSQQAMQNHTSNTNWCGIFGVWNVAQGRPADGVRWILDGKTHPPGLILCTDIDKLHKGDVGHKTDAPALADQRKWDADEATVKAAHDDWTPEQIAAQVKSDTGLPKRPGLLNHHVLVTDPESFPRARSSKGTAGRLIHWRNRGPTGRHQRIKRPAL